MPEPETDPFSAGGTFAANPHLYDYLHFLVFDATGTVEMQDGAGQRLNTLVCGHFSSEQLAPNVFQAHFSEMVELNPYYKMERFRGLDFDTYFQAVQGDVPYEEQDIRSHPEPFSVQITREDGLFFLRRQVVWKIADEDDWPYLLYRVRYVFDSDPLEQFEPNRQGGLYYELEPPELDTCIYYRREDAQELTARDLHDMGIAIEDEQS